MSELDHLQSLMAEIGPLIDGIEAIDQEGDDYWLFAFGEQTLLQIQYDAQARKLVLFTELGAPAEENRLALYEALLSFNYLWNETGGLRMAIDGPGGSASMVLDLFVLDLDVSTLATVTENFLDTAVYWRGFMANLQSAEQETPAPRQEDGAGGPGIRV